MPHATETAEYTHVHVAMDGEVSSGHTGVRPSITQIMIRYSFFEQF